MVMLNFKCQRCGECCKRYYIVSLPHEVSAQQEFLRQNRAEFMQKNTQLFLQLFQTEHRKDKPVISSSLLPKRLLEQISAHLGHTPDFFICLPMIAFKRRGDGSCTFYDEKNSGCTIYGVRPTECRLFPFISDKKVDNYAQLYPFCKGLKTKSEDKSYVDVSFIHFDEVAAYFSKLQEQGFSALWSEWPQSGICLFTDKLLGEISEKEFFDAIGPYK